MRCAISKRKEKEFTGSKECGDQFPSQSIGPAHRMDDLIDLNRRIAEHWLGGLDAEQETYLTYTSVCLGQLTHSAAELAHVLACSKQEHHNSLPVAKLNRQYLNFARLAAKDVAAGKPEMLIRLGINLAQAKVLGDLTNEKVDRLAFGWDGPIIRFASQAFRRGVALNVRAAKIHATALVATHFSTKTGEGS